MSHNQTIEDIPVQIPLAKRIFDILFSGAVILLCSPLWVLIIILQKLEGLCIPSHRGPIFYTETRMSQGKPFTLRKFRIFKVSAYQPIRDRGEIVHTKPLEKNADNLTYIGTLLKNFYLDEAPQLLSILFGDMSFIGPRPWNPVDYEKEIATGVYRKKIIKAGLTGPVQIHKLDANKYGGEQFLDNTYIQFVQNHSGIRVVIHDIWLLVQSFFFMIKGQGL